MSAQSSEGYILTKLNDPVNSDAPGLIGCRIELLNNTGKSLLRLETDGQGLHAEWSTSLSALKSLKRVTANLSSEASPLIQRTPIELGGWNLELSDGLHIGYIPEPTDEIGRFLRDAGEISGSMVIFNSPDLAIASLKQCMSTTGDERIATHVDEIIEMSELHGN